jgi:hypothetical protein
MRALVLFVALGLVMSGAARAQGEQPNCLYKASSSGIYCDPATSDCCGYSTMFPSCMAKDSGNKCCVWYSAATQCNSTQSCCGGLGPGASSYASCCNEGTACCTARIGYDGSSSCCRGDQKCCQASTFGYCCEADEECDTDAYTCRKIGAPETPAQVPDTPQPPTPETNAAVTPTPQSPAPLPDTPQPAGPQPVTPQPSGPRPSASEPTSVPQPSAPQPSGPQPSSPQSPAPRQTDDANEGEPTNAPATAVVKVPVTASIDVAGTKFDELEANAAGWAALREALVADLAELLEVDADAITITAVEARANALHVAFTVDTESQSAAAYLRQTVLHLAADDGTVLERTTQQYRTTDATAEELRVTSADSDVPSGASQPDGNDVSIAADPRDLLSMLLPATATVYVLSAL